MKISMFIWIFFFGFLEKDSFWRKTDYECEYAHMQVSKSYDEHMLRCSLVFEFCAVGVICPLM